MSIPRQMAGTSPIILEPERTPAMTAIWLHGLGADGRDLVPVAQALDVPMPVRHVLPSAPVRPVTINQGLPMRAWFDIDSLDWQRGVDRAGLDESVSQAATLAQAYGMGAVVAVGFSQGGVVAQRLALALQERSACVGVAVLSSWTPFAIERNALSAFVSHGLADEVVPVRLGRDACRKWAAAGARVVCRFFPGRGHGIGPEGVQALGEWLKEVWNEQDQ